MDCIQVPIKTQQNSGIMQAQNCNLQAVLPWHQVLNNYAHWELNEI